MARRRRRWIVALAIGTAVLGVAVVGEIVARDRLGQRIDGVDGALPGVSASLSATPALLQLAGGRVEVRFAVQEAVLDGYANCRSEHPVSVRVDETGLVVTVERTVHGFALPVDVTLIPRHRDGEWSLVADTVSAAGISVPADRALGLLAGADGAASGVAARLLDGIALPSDGDLVVTSVDFTAGAAIVTAGIALDRTSGGGSGGSADLRSCLTTQGDDR